MISKPLEVKVPLFFSIEIAMIEENCVKKYCKDDPSLIENYDKAVADTTQTWDLHHRREISEGKSKKQLLAEGLYYQRPASELIFITKGDHHRLHNEHMSLETRAKISAANKGEKNPMFGKAGPWKGKTRSLETRAKMSANNAHTMKGKTAYNKGKPRSEEVKVKISAALKGKHRSIDVRAKISAAQKGKHMIIGHDGMRHWSSV